MAEDIFGIFGREETDARPDPVAAARQANAPPRPKRFWREARMIVTPDGFGVALDGRLARTPRRRPLVAPTEDLGEALASEWRAVGETIDPSALPLTRLVNVAIDHVAETMDAVAADVVRYARSDLVCYRAGHPESLVAQQSCVWDPVLDWASEALGARFILSEGVRHVAQPEESIARVAAAVAAITQPLPLAGLHAMTTIAGSALIALAVAHGALDAADGFAASQVDEEHQFAAWGEDAEARAAQAARRREFLAAARCGAAIAGGGVTATG